MPRKNLLSLVGRWLGTMLLLVVALTPIVVHTLTSMKVHAASNVKIYVSSKLTNNIIRGVQGHYSAPGSTSIARPCFDFTSNELLEVPQGTQIQLIATLDPRPCHNLIVSNSQYKDQDVTFNVGNATSCTVTFFDGGTAQSKPTHKC